MQLTSNACHSKIHNIYYTTGSLLHCKCFRCDSIQFDITNIVVFESTDRVDIESPVRLRLHVSPFHFVQYLLALDVTAVHAYIVQYIYKYIIESHTFIQPNTHSLLLWSTASRTTIDKSWLEMDFKWWDLANSLVIEMSEKKERMDTCAPWLHRIHYLTRVHLKYTFLFC